MITFERVGKPEPAFEIQQIGEDPDIRYRYHWDECGDPTPEEFERVTDIETKLAVLSGQLSGDVEAAAIEALEAIQNLQSVMLDARDLDEEQRLEVSMGNLEGLPEVERHVE